MERLTEWDEFGNADIIALSDMMPEIYAELSFSETNALTEALNCLAKYEDAMPLERAQELAQAEKDGRLVVLQDNITVHDLQREYRNARHMADEQLPSPSYTTEHIAGFGEGAIHILDKILTREEAEAALKKREAENEAD